MAIMPPVPYPGSGGWVQGSTAWYDAQNGQQNDCGIQVTATPADALRKALSDSTPYHGKVLTTCAELTDLTTHINVAAFCQVIIDHLLMFKTVDGRVESYLLYKPDQYFEGFSYVFSRKDVCTMPWHLEWNGRQPPQFELFEPDFETVAGDCRDAMSMYILPDLAVPSWPTPYQGSAILFLGQWYASEQAVRDNAPVGIDWYAFFVTWQMQFVLHTKAFAPVFGGNPLPAMPPMFPLAPLGVGGLPFGLVPGLADALSGRGAPGAGGSGGGKPEDERQ